jgi:hypothetical protein
MTCALKARSNTIFTTYYNVYDKRMLTTVFFSNACLPISPSPNLFFYCWGRRIRTSNVRAPNANEVTVYLTTYQYFNNTLCVILCCLS